MANWKIDTQHATADFRAQHLGIAWVKGIITGITGSIELDPENIEASKFEGTLDATTLNTGQEQRDGHLKSADFLDVENYKEIKFVSKSVEKITETNAKVIGDMTIKDTTKEVELDVTFYGTTEKQNMEGAMETVAAFSILTTIDRYDFGINWNVDLPGGKFLVGKEIKIEVNLEAIKE